jgi:hypothetical protein
MSQNPNTLVLDRREGLVPDVYLGAGRLAVASTVEVARYASDPDILPPSFVEQHRSDWSKIGPNQDAFVDCSDDRIMTAESIALIMAHSRENMLSPLEGTASIFGGLSGAVMAVLQAGVATYGPKFIGFVGGFHGVARQLIRGGDGSFTWHTAESAEGNAAAFNPKSEAAIACAYNEFIGTVAEVLAKPPGIHTSDTQMQRVARHDQDRIFGKNDLAVDGLFEATYHVAQHFAHLARQSTGNRKAKASDFRVDRKMYADFQGEKSPSGYTSVPIEVLLGQHLPCAETGVITNFNLGEVGKAGHFYRLGAGRVADEIMKAEGIRDLQLPAELLVRAIQLNSVPPRAVLYSHDKVHGKKHGPLDPIGLRMSWIGDPWAAIRELDQRHNA